MKFVCVLGYSSARYNVFSILSSQGWSFPIVDQDTVDSSGVTELPQSGLFAYAHVEDVVDAHVCAFEEPEASGRYICYEGVVGEKELVEYIRKLYPDSIIPSR